MKFLIIGFIVSFVVAMLLVRSAHRHARLSADSLRGPQKVHSVPVPRVGGISLFIAAVCGAAWAHWMSHRELELVWALLVAAVPAFASGLAEDVTGSVSARRRLVLTLVSAALGVWLLGAVEVRLDLPFAKEVLSWYPLCVALSVLLVAGMCNAINIIDGFNGLASMCVLFMMLALAYVSFQVEDMLVYVVALTFIGAIVGFFVWNFPAGLIFLGDGGAYLLGFVTAELSVLLVARNETVSPLFPLLLCIYPIFETLFSIYRRSFVRGVAATSPDAIHLHTLIYRRVVRVALDMEDERRQMVRNSMTSPFLWALCLLSVIPAVLWWENSATMAAFIAVFAASYVLLYQRILTFRTPKWLYIFRR